MAKRKNPLKDLDAFLKQEAKNFVQPNKVKAPSIKEESANAYNLQATTSEQLTDENVAKYLSELKLKGDESFYTVIQSAVEKAGLESSENKMLINTLLYLKDKDNWKDAVKEYWS